MRCGLLPGVEEDMSDGKDRTMEKLSGQEEEVKDGEEEEGGR